MSASKSFDAETGDPSKSTTSIAEISQSSILAKHRTSCARIGSLAFRVCNSK
jgi:hypothetical protein